MGTTLGTFVAGQKLTFADNEFTLPCGTWTVRRGPTPARALFDVIIDVIVINPIETLHLSGHVVGAMTTSVRVFDCPPHQATKQAQPPGCP